MQLARQNNHTSQVTAEEFLVDVLDGLGGEQKTLYSKYFYDDTGSRYFDDICELAEYYPYRTELEMLPGISLEIADIIQTDIDLIEFGAGSLIKVRPVLQNLQGIRRYVPIDIAGEHLLEATNRLRQECRLGDLEIMPVEADFSRGMDLTGVVNRLQGTVRLGFFPGSTIGNFSQEQAGELLHDMRLALGQKSWLLIGIDTKKSPAILHRAYNDAAGVTAKFNKNLLVRINNELGGNFNLDKFEHSAFYNEKLGRVEMHLVSLEKQHVKINDQVFSFSKGESIHTENSYKYSPPEFVTLAEKSGWRSIRQWQDDEKLFSHYLLYNSNP